MLVLFGLVWRDRSGEEKISLQDDLPSLSLERFACGVQYGNNGVQVFEGLPIQLQ